MKKNYYDGKSASEEVLAVDVDNLYNDQNPAEYALQQQTRMQKQCQQDLARGTVYPTEHCLTGQDEIHVRTRQVLVSWLNQVHSEFKLLPQTLFLAVNLLDRYTQQV